MTIASPAAFAASGPPIPAAPLMDVTADYRPGVCNIGPAEIARRRRSGHIGVITAVVLFGVLVVIDAPPLARLLVAAPAIIAASGYLQAWLKFCAGFGSAGVFNFGDVGTTEAVADTGHRLLWLQARAARGRVEAAARPAEEGVRQEARQDAEDPDAHGHRRHADHPALRGHRIAIAVADGSDRDEGPPERVAAGLDVRAGGRRLDERHERAADQHHQDR